MWPEGVDPPSPMMSVTCHRTASRETAERLEGPRGNSVALVQEAEEEMLRSDLVVVEEPRLLLRQDDHATGPIGEALEHDPQHAAPDCGGESAGECRGRVPARRALVRLMFDVQVRGHGGPELPEPVRSSIAAYYVRVTTAARPMNRLVALAMLTTIGAEIALLFGDELPVWRAASLLVLTVAAVGLAGAHTVPAAVRLGTRRDDAATQTALARGILRDHLICIAAIVGSLLVLLVPA